MFNEFDVLKIIRGSFTSADANGDFIAATYIDEGH